MIIGYFVIIFIIAIEDICTKRCCFGHGLPINCLEEKRNTHRNWNYNDTHVHVGIGMSVTGMKYEKVFQECSAECLDHEEGK